MTRKLVAVESFYAFGDVEKNVEFARNVCRWAVDRGYNPYAMHLFFTQFLDDTVPEERKTGIDCGLGWTDLAEEVWYCLRPEDDIENSKGMNLSLKHNHVNRPERTLRFMIFSQEGKLLAHTSNERIPAFIFHKKPPADINKQIAILKKLL